MSLTTTANRAVFSGNGVTTVWPFAFKVLAASHLSVIFTDADDNETVLAPNLYTIEGIGDAAGGSVTYPLSGSPVASGTTLTLLRTVPLTQTDVLSNQGGYFPEVIERRLDLLTMALQQLAGHTNVSGVSVTATGSTTERSLAARFAEQTNVLDFGATGDGTTDDGPAIAAAIAAAPTGGSVFFPKPAVGYTLTSAIVVNKALTLYGIGKPLIVQTSANAAGISVTASDVHIESLYLQGPGNGTFADNSRAVTATGTFNAGLAPTYITNLSVTDCRLEDWDAYGVNLAYVDQFLVFKTTILNTNYGGIVTESAKNGLIGFNTIDTVGPGTAFNAYGIALSRRTTDAGNLTSQPRTTDVVVIANIVRNVPEWEGIDTHAGERITIVINNVYNCYVGILVGGSKNSAGADTYGAKSVTVACNMVESGVTDGSAAHGILFHGEAGAEAATGNITGNTVKNHGDQANVDNGGAIYVYRTSGVTIASNSIVNPSPRGIVIHTNNLGLVVQANGVVDAWTDTVGAGAARGIYIVDENNTAAIAGNSFSTNGKTATYLLTTASGAAIYVANATGVAVQLGPNYSVATTYLVDAGFKAVTTTPTLDVSFSARIGFNLDLSAATLVRWGNTASEPMLKRSGTRVQAKLGNDSAFAGFDAADAAFTGLVSTPASATGSAGLRVPHGTAPSAPVDGDMWTTTAGLFVRINGATVGPLS